MLFKHIGCCSLAAPCYPNEEGQPRPCAPCLAGISKTHRYSPSSLHLQTDRYYQMKSQILDSLGYQMEELFPVYADKMPTQLLAYLRLARVQDPGLLAKVGLPHTTRHGGPGSSQLWAGQHPLRIKRRGSASAALTHLASPHAPGAGQLRAGHHPQHTKQKAHVSSAYQVEGPASAALPHSHNTLSYSPTPPAQVNFEQDIILSDLNEYEILQILMGDCRERLQAYPMTVEEEIKYSQVRWSASRLTGMLERQ